MTKITTSLVEQTSSKLAEAASSEEVGRLLDLHPWLISTETELQLTALIQQKTAPTDLTNKIKLLACREFIRRCRVNGVDHSIAEQNKWPLAVHNPLQQLLSLPGTAQPETRRQVANQALKLVNIETEADVYGLVQYNLGLAWQAEVNAGNHQAIAQAVEHFTSALGAWQSKPLSNRFTGRAYSNLGRLYLLRQSRNRKEDIETALNHFQQALRFLPEKTEKGFVEPARTIALTLLGDGYLQRLTGERRGNIEQAIEHFNAALNLAETNNQPNKAANIKHNLAVAYRLRLAGKPVDNYEMAMNYAQDALKRFDQFTTPEEWARVCLELATILAHRQQGDRGSNLEQAINLAKDTLLVYRPTTHLQQWLLVKMTLGNLYCERVTDSHSYDNEKAIACFETVIAHCDSSTLPIRWAEAQNNLGTVYAERSRLPDDEAYRQAVACFERASKIRTPDTLPDQARRTALNWGNLTFRFGQWSEALSQYETALAAGEVLFQSSATPAGRRVELAENAGLAVNSAFCLAKEQQFDQALLVLDHGKTRMLTEALALSEANLTVLPNDQQQNYRMAVERVQTREAEYRRLSDVSAPSAGASRPERDIFTDLTQARTELNALIETIRQEFPGFMPTGLDLPQLLDFIPQGGALIAPVVTVQGSVVFVVPHGTNAITADHILWLDDFTNANSHALLIGTEAEPGWLQVYLKNRSASADWREALKSIIEQLWGQLVNPIVNKLTQLGVEREASLLVMPQGGLGLLPLHAPLLDDYCVAYAPSGFALHAARQRLQANGDTPTSLLAVVNPTGDLPFTPAEGDAIATLFGPEQVTRLDENEAALEAVSQHLQPATRRLLHFSGHGFYDWDEAMQSGLVLADGELTLSQLISQADLSVVRLVTLSACETGITDIRQSPDEFLGLPAGLMQAGAPAVISTLWAVNDLSTMLLMERFYRNYLQEGLAIPEALRQAQLWLRDVTAGELTERFSEERLAMLGIRLPADVISDGYRRFSLDYEADDRPFEHPYYWAAFTFSGV